MGLDAVVYRNRAQLKLGSDEEFVRFVPETGEIYFESEKLSRKYYSQLRAEEQRLGNIAEIAALREEAGQIIGPNIVMIQTVLRSGTHSGDRISADSILSLAAEVNLIHEGSQRSSELQRLIISLEKLIQAARNEGNPIVFV
jgi:hypothetical protein